MAILPGIGTATAERIISSGGNIYSLAAAKPIKTGYATRGRGFWVGKKRKDEQNPDVDSPLAEGLDVNAQEGAVDDPNDGFDDNRDPMLALFRKQNLRGVYANSRKQGREAARASARAFGHAVGDMSPQPVFVAKGVKMDLLLQNPEQLSKAELLANAAKVKSMVDRGYLDPHEHTIIRGYAARVARALRELINAEQGIAKAILTKTQDEKDKEEKKAKEAKKPPKKAQEVTRDATGKKQYKYAKKDDAKGPQSDGVKPEPQPEAEAPGGEHAEHAAEPQVSPPPPVDVTGFAEKLGIPETQIHKLAQKKSRMQFVNFFMHHGDLVQKHGISVAFLGRLYDTLTIPQEPEQAEKALSPLTLPDAMLKSVVVFNGATMNRQTLAVVDFLKSHKVRTIGDVVSRMQTYYCTTPDMATRTARTLLRKWEQEGLVTFYPPQE